MRTIIAGGRDCNNPDVLIEALDSCPWEPSVVICGMAKGADTLGLEWATDCDIPVIRCYPEWTLPGGVFDKTAGYKRNIEMAKLGEGLLALWDGYSKGTAHMINTANKLKLKVHVYLYDESRNIKSNLSKLPTRGL